MDRLPLEIWLLICDQSVLSQDTRALKCFRRTCKHFAVVGLQYLFREISVSISKSSLDRLEKLSAHPTIPSLVRHLRCYVDILEGETHIQFLSSHYVRANVHAELSVVYGDLRERYSEQVELLASLRPQRVLKKAAKELQSLQSLTITTSDQYQCFIPPGNTGYNIGIGHTFEMIGTGMAHSVLSNLHGSAQLKEFNYHCFCGRFYDDNHDLSFTDHHLKNLSSISLCMYTRRPGEVSCRRYRHRPIADFEFILPAEGRSEARTQRMNRFFLGMSWLKNLTVNFADPVGGRSWNLADVVGEGTWPNLESLDISGLELTKSHALEFLGRHVAALRVLALGNIGNIDCSYKDFLQELQGTTSLDSIIFRGYLSFRFNRDNAVRMNHHRYGYRPFKTMSAGLAMYIGRALRYLICGKKTDYCGEPDRLTNLPDTAWDHVKWEGVTFAGLIKPGVPFP